MENIYINKVKQIERHHDFLIKKRLGQNFLIDGSVINALLNAAELSENDTVLEIGPGLGFLTEVISFKAKKILAVEKDKQLWEYLKKQLPKKNIKLINGDIFTVNLAKHNLKDLQYKIIANIPYYLTAKLLRYFCENKIRPRLMSILVQKEVAERVTAKKGNHSLLSLSVQFYARVEKIMDVDQKSFYPSPEITSSLIKISMGKKPKFNDVDVNKFFRMLKIAFSSRRKQLHNNFSNGFKISSDKFRELFQDLHIDPMVRAQALDLEDWHRIYLKLLENNLL